jgi:hypothetical protein
MLEAAAFISGIATPDQSIKALRFFRALTLSIDDVESIQSWVWDWFREAPSHLWINGLRCDGLGDAQRLPEWACYRPSPPSNEENFVAA